MTGNPSRPFAVVACLLLLAVGAFAQGMKDGSTDPAVLKRLAKEWDAASTALARAPKDPKVRERYATAGVLYGHESMVSPILSSKVKYRQAALIYRKVLKVDPRNEVAKPEYEMIMSIYRQLHKKNGTPIP